MSAHLTPPRGPPRSSRRCRNRPNRHPHPPRPPLTSRCSSSQPAAGPSAEAPAASSAGETTASSTTASSASVGDVVQIVGSSSGVATASEPAERLIPACPTTYVAGAGDSWYRIADAADVSPNALLDENRATVDTVILPGDEICLPTGYNDEGELSALLSAL